MPERETDEKFRRSLARAFLVGTKRREQSERRKVIQGFRRVDAVVLERIERKLDAILSACKLGDGREAWNDTTRA
jgi:hypothetical protein